MNLASVLVAAALGSSMPTMQADDRVAEIRVHGNHATPEHIILGLAGLAIDQRFTERSRRDAEQRLAASGRFERVEVLKRFLSIEDPTEVLVLILVDERPGTGPDGLVPGPVGRLLGQSMFAPILGFEDGYGFTYGARVSLVEPLGPRSRISVPLSWGGERQAGIEIEQSLSGPIVSRVFGAFSVKRRENPFYEIGDTRRTALIGVDRVFTSWLAADATVRIARVSFGDVDESHRAFGARVTIDTRRDPVFPRDAIYAQGGWERLDVEGRSGIHRWTGDVDGYLGLVGPAVLAVGIGIDRASAPLPPQRAGASGTPALPAYEQRLLGGTQMTQMAQMRGRTLRGYRAGTAVGDSLAVASAELRVPLTSPLSVGRFGVKTFVDLGATWNEGERLIDRQWSRGIGGGAFLNLAAFLVGIDVAWAENGKARGHVTLGVKF